VIWDLIAIYLRHRGTPSIVLPTPLTVLRGFLTSVGDGVLPAYVADSLTHLFEAGVTGLAIGVAVGLVLGLNRRIARVCYPLLNFFQSLGGVAVTPLIIVWFGFSFMGLIVAVNYTIFFPVVFNTMTGVSTVPKVYVDAMRTMGASRLQIVRDVILPGAMPNIILGARLAFAFGWRALIIVEMLFSINGIGFMIFDAQQYLDTSSMIFGMITLGVLWIIVDELILKPFESLTIRRWGLVQR
jgi:taurine transport system permease protein